MGGCGSGVQPVNFLLSEGCWFNFPGLHVTSVFGQDTEPLTAPDVLDGTLQGSHRHQCMNVFMN